MMKRKGRTARARRLCQTIPPTFSPTISLHVNHLRRRVERPMDADFLPFELTYFRLMIDVINRPTGVLKHVLVSLLHDCARKDLNTSLVGRLSLRIRRSLLCVRLGLAGRRGLIGGRLRWLLALSCVRGSLLGVEQPAPRDDPD